MFVQENSFYLLKYLLEILWTSQGELLHALVCQSKKKKNPRNQICGEEGFGPDQEVPICHFYFYFFMCDNIQIWRFKDHEVCKRRGGIGVNKHYSFETGSWMYIIVKGVKTVTENVRQLGLREAIGCQ